MAGNDAVQINKANVGIGITDHGSDWYWTCFSIFGLMALVHAGLYVVFHRGSTEKKNRAILHVSPLAASAVLAYTYYTLASNLGWTGIKTEFNHIEIGDDTRQIFYARYIGWFLAFPCLLYSFELNSMAQNVLTSGDYLQIFHTLFLQVCSTEVFVLGLLIGALVHTTYKWGYWVFGISAQLFMLTIFTYHQFTTVSTSLITKLLVPFFGVCFILYPVNWGLSEGGNVIQPDSEGVFYGVLDLMLFWLIPIALIFDSNKNGHFVDSDNLANSNRVNDVEKQVNPSPELRASGETEVGNHDEGALETHHD